MCLFNQIGEKPSQIISPNNSIGGYISEKVSNGDTEIYINGREITKPELTMLKVLLLFTFVLDNKYA